MLDGNKVKITFQLRETGSQKVSIGFLCDGIVNDKPVKLPRAAYLIANSATDNTSGAMSLTVFEFVGPIVVIDNVDHPSGIEFTLTGTKKGTFTIQITFYVPNLEKGDTLGIELSTSPLALHDFTIYSDAGGSGMKPLGNAKTLSGATHCETISW